MKALNRFIDSFKPAIETEGETESIFSSQKPSRTGQDSSQEDHEKSYETHSIGPSPPQKKLLKKNLKSRHLAAIALGGGIGTGLFVGSGSTLYQGGPGSIIINYTIMGLMILMVLFALGELGSLYPVPGAFSDYASRFIDPAVGFAVGYNYSMNWIITLPLEFTASAIVVSFWNTPEHMPNGVIITIYLLFIIFINLFGARGYAEFEFFATSLKMLTLVGFIICGVIIDCGGVSGTSYMGAHTWHEPGAFHNSFKGFCSVLTTAAFAFSGTEIVALAAAESSEPRKQLPRACKLVVYRVLIFYTLSLFIVTLLVPYDNPSLHGDNSYDPKTSPFVIAVQSAGIHVLPHIINAIIAISAISVSNSSVYASSRMIHALAEQGKAPSIFKYVDRTGRPLMAVLFALLFGLLGFLIYVKNEGEVFSWLLSISGLSVVFTWAATCLGHIRFRAAWAKQGRRVEELPWTSPLGVYGSYIGFIFNVMVIVAQFYVSAFPIGEGDMTSNDRVYNFFLGMLSLPIFMCLLFGYKIIKRTKIVRLEDVDLVSGMRYLEPLEVLEQQRAESRALPFHKKLLAFFF
ncbi:Similar to S.cerevisiae protein GAP1 (General amino acid permease) [Malassezia sympodialis ATCC 42132]|uniref:Similar to S.cerevisiae protein GAP1 (General amino acid permease) n=1 Tax=Malassezia sympodialis (strain ATCC 42132) TaxID=1230383 RepID=A0A1M8A249_MALS4|nr:Similar to S.cerevisiae protein GAP1 (General amino acid permease) [Malassezia sympodialis ATCC 42132]